MTINEYKELVDKKLAEYFVCEEPMEHSGLADAMRYSLLAGGKRIRPILVLEFCRVSGGNVQSALPVACAIEMLHTYSLIHDDLPCMDNDELRRGKPTNHVIYGECTATLAGDALQAAAFETILDCELPADRRAECAAILARSAGLDGICGGQYLDMLGEGKSLSEDELTNINSRKTGALLVAACQMGVAAAGMGEDKLTAAASYGASIGAAFQIRDDMLDVLSTDYELGKPVGSDAQEHKNTYMALFGAEKCENMIYKLTEYAKKTVKDNFDDSDFLCALADSLASRNK